MYRRAIRRKQRINAATAAPQPAPPRSSWSPPTSLAAVPSREPLIIGAANDPAERAADAAAEGVMRSGGEKVPPIATAPSGTAVRRESAGGGAAGATPAGPRARGALAALGAGAPLPAAERAFFEPRFGADLSGIRVHADRASASASQAIAARAFALGADIGFAPGEYRPGTGEGRRLLAHEIAHVVQGGGAGVVRRKPCKDAVPACDEEKKKAAEAKVEGHKTYKNFVYGAATDDCAIPENMAEKLKETNGGLFTGSASKYGDEVVGVNGVNPKRIRAGMCFAFPVGWKDSNIGDLDAELTALRSKKNSALRNRIIAGVYAEMSLSTKDAADADEQRAYILYSMLTRIEDQRFKPKLAQIAVSKSYHAIDSSGNYSDAIAYLENPKGKAPKTLNTDAVDKVQALVGGVTAQSIPADAGPYYFHWREGGGAETTTAKEEYARLIASPPLTVAEEAFLGRRAQGGKPPNPAIKPMEAEMLAARKQMREAVGNKTAEKWSRRIPGKNKGKADERIGTMYIYK